MPNNPVFDSETQKTTMIIQLEKAVERKGFGQMMKGGKWWDPGRDKAFLHGFEMMNRYFKRMSLWQYDTSLEQDLNSFSRLLSVPLFSVLASIMSSQFYCLFSFLFFVLLHPFMLFTRDFEMGSCFGKGKGELRRRRGEEKIEEDFNGKISFFPLPLCLLSSNLAFSTPLFPHISGFRFVQTPNSSILNETRALTPPLGGSISK